MQKKLRRKSVCILCLLISVMLIFSGSPVVLASSNIWYDKYVTLEGSIGDAYTSSADSGVLAWNEAYVIESYVQMYKNTKNTAWLDKFTSHADTIIGNANDLDGDGYLGWDTWRYSEKLLANSGFETAVTGDNLTPESWTRWQGTSSNLYRYTSPAPYGGTAGLCTKSRTDGLWTWMTQTVTNYIPNVRQNFRIYAKVGASSTGRAWVRDETSGIVLATITFNGTDWAFYEASFTAPAAGHTLKVYLGLNSLTSGQVAYYDEVYISPYFGYMVHDASVGLPISKFIRLVNETPALQPAYQAKANTYRAFIENNTLQRWENGTYYGNCWVSASSTEGYYRFSSNMDTYSNSAPGEILPYNMMLNFAEMLYNMYTVNSNTTYLNRAQKIMNYWKNRLSVNGTSPNDYYLWNYANLSGSRVEDVSHGMLDTGAALLGFRDAVPVAGGSTPIFNGTAMERFTNTLTDKLWHPTATPPYVSYLIDGTGNTSGTRALANWMDFCQFDMGVWEIGASQYRSYTPDRPLDLFVLSEIIEWDPQRVVNRDFELKTSFDDTQPARWVRNTGATSTSACLDSSEKYEGNYSAAIVANGSTENGLFATQKDWSTNTTYTVKFYGKTDGSAAGGRVEVKNDTTGEVLGYAEFTSTTWTEYTFTFKSPGTSTDNVRVFLKNKLPTQTSGKANIDNIRIIKNGDPY